MRRYLTIAATITIPLCLGAIPASVAAPHVATPAKKSAITVIATLHGLHAKSPRYSYSTLYSLIACLKPDHIGVEIRQEDLGRPKEYLEANYPREMIDLASGKASVFGFDWLGDDVAHAPIPADWWSRQSPMKRLERELDRDARSHDSRLAAITARENEILANATPGALNSRLYDDLNDAYYARLAFLLAGTDYEALSEFYARRDYHLALNIAAFVKRHEGSRIVVVTGADHRSALMRLLKSWFGEALQWAPIEECPGEAGGTSPGV